MTKTIPVAILCGGKGTRLKEELVQFLEKNQVGTRLLFGSNLIRQPLYQSLNYRVIGDLSNADRIMYNSFWIGLFPGLTEEMLTYSVSKIREFININ